MYFCYCWNVRIMHNVTFRQQSNVIMAPTFRPVRRTEWCNYVQMEVKGDSLFLRNENPTKNIKFWVISQYMGIFQGLFLCNKVHWGSGKLCSARIWILCVLQLWDRIWKVCEGKLIHHVFFYSHSVWKWTFFRNKWLSLTMCQWRRQILTHTCLVESSILPIGWRVHFQFKVCPVFFFIFAYFFTEIHVSKQCKPWSDAAFCDIWSGSTLFALVPFMGR